MATSNHPPARHPPSLSLSHPPTSAKTFNQISGLAGVKETPFFGGSCLAYMAVDASLDAVSGKFYDTYPPGKHQLASHAPSVEGQNVDEQKKLWDLSAKLVGV